MNTTLTTAGAATATGRFRPSSLPIARHIGWGFVVLLSGFYLFFPNARLDFSIFDQHDAESYLALSESLISGRGYTRSLDPLHYASHTTWPPGVPLLLEPYALLAGMPVNPLIIKIGMIGYGIIGIVLAYLYAQRVAASISGRLAVVALLGLNPYYWQFSRMTNSELPAIVWSILALVLVHDAWSNRRPRHSTALFIGLVCGLGMLIRGSLFGIGLLPIAYIVLGRPGPVSVRQDLTRYGCYLGGFLVPFSLWCVRNALLEPKAIGFDGINQLAMIMYRNPIDPGSGFRSVGEIANDIVTNLKYHGIYVLPKSIIPGMWHPEFFAGLRGWSAITGIALTLAIAALSLSTVRNLPILVLCGSTSVLNFFYAYGGMERLWVPVSCLIAISLPVAVERLRAPRVRRAAVIAGGSVLAAAPLSLLLYIHHHEEHPYRDRDYAALAELFTEIRRHPLPEGNVLTRNSLAFGLFTANKAPVGVDYTYRYVILPAVEWRQEQLRGMPVLRNSVWTVVELEPPLKFGEIMRRYPRAAEGM